MHSRPVSSRPCNCRRGRRHSPSNRNCTACCPPPRHRWGASCGSASSRWASRGPPSRNARAPRCRWRPGNGPRTCPCGNCLCRARPTNSRNRKRGRRRASTWWSWPAVPPPPFADRDAGFALVGRRIISAAKRGDPIGAARLLLDAARRGRAPTQGDYEAVVVGCANIGDLERAEAWLELMRLAGAEVRVDLARSMLRTLRARCRARPQNWPLSARSSSQWLRGMCHDRKLPLSPALVLGVLSFLATAREAEEAERWVLCLEGHGMEPTATMIELLIDACIRAGDDEKAMRWGQVGIGMSMAALMERSASEQLEVNSFGAVVSGNLMFLPGAGRAVDGESPLAEHLLEAGRLLEAPFHQDPSSGTHLMRYAM
mmetsp:Transcript_106526/g.308269  ORF Transcript_106526/g.308269 Transcript_106526/m.308269 type:complete len:372 (+) Transcript_106526:107-1222(+)